MADAWNVSVASVDTDGNLTLSGDIETTQITGADNVLTLGGTSDSVEVGSTTSFEVSGDVLFLDLPTSDPTVAGQIWSDSGVLTVSAGA